MSRMRYLGIDYGTKKIGLALSDDAGKMGFPRGVVMNDAKLLDYLVAYVTDEHVGGIVIGESRDLSGNDNAIVPAARALGAELSERAGVQVHFEQELFTTQAARRFPDGTRMAGSPDVDASAAAIILSSYLSRINPTSDDDHDHD
jgi:putative Holliday junction resolvase